LEPYTRALDCIADGALLYHRLVSDGLDERQARSIIRLLWLAAVTTTERAISWCVMRLLQHDDVRRHLERNPAQIAAFVEEVLRLHPPELMVPRMTTAETQLGGVTIPANAIVHLVIAAANRDPEIFANASELRLDRPATRHFSFGSGIHHCVGATLGRRTIETAVRTLLQRAPRFRSAQSLNESIVWCTMTANPIGTLRVELA
jgi:pimeloyl-[acyl-carrier protein] synthase